MSFLEKATDQPEKSTLPVKAPNNRKKFQGEFFYIIVKLYWIVLHDLNIDF